MKHLLPRVIYVKIFLRVILSLNFCFWGMIAPYYDPANMPGVISDKYSIGPDEFYTPFQFKCLMAGVSSLILMSLI